MCGPSVEEDAFMREEPRNDKIRVRGGGVCMYDDLCVLPQPSPVEQDVALGPSRSTGCDDRLRRLTLQSFS